MSKPNLQNIIETAISKADSSYFFEDYTKQAKAVIAAMTAAGFTFVHKEITEDVWVQAAKDMRTGRLKPEEHVKDVYQVVMRILMSR
jgi:hypothetical protein